MRRGAEGGFSAPSLPPPPTHALAEGFAREATHRHAQTHTSVYRCMYVRMYVLNFYLCYIYIYIYIYIYLHTYVCMRACSSPQLQEETNWQEWSLQRTQFGKRNRGQIGGKEAGACAQACCLSVCVHTQPWALAASPAASSSSCPPTQEKPLFLPHITAASVRSCPRAFVRNRSQQRGEIRGWGEQQASLAAAQSQGDWGPNRRDKLQSDAASPPPFAAEHVRPAQYQLPDDAWQQRLLAAESEDVLCRMLVQEGAALSAAQTVEAWRKLLLRQYAHAPVAAGEGGGRGGGGHGHLFAQSLGLLEQNLARQMATLTFRQLARVLQALVYGGTVVGQALLSALDMHLREAAGTVEARKDLRGVAAVLWAYGVAQRLDRRLFGSLCQCICEAHLSQDRLDIDSLTDLVWGLAQGSRLGYFQDKSPRSVLQALHADLERAAHTARPENMSALLSSLAQLGLPPDAPVLVLLSDQMATVIGDMTPEQLSAVFSVFAALKFKPSNPTLNLMAERALECCVRFSALSAVDMLCACAKNRFFFFGVRLHCVCFPRR